LLADRHQPSTQGASLRNWRVLTAVAAVVLAVLAGLLAWRYLSDADERAQQDAELVPVLVAATEIPRGTAGQDALADGMLRTTSVPRESRPPDALPPDQEDAISGFVASSTIGEGQFILASSFQSAGSVSGFAGSIRDGFQALAVQVDESHAAGGFVAPGDLVNIIVNRADVSEFLIEGVPVLAVGETTSASDGGDDGSDNLGGGVVTLEVTRDQALQLTDAVQTGTIWLTLNPAASQPDTSG
jgi:pilus assembly protein CpaB